MSHSEVSFDLRAKILDYPSENYLYPPKRKNTNGGFSSVEKVQFQMVKLYSSRSLVDVKGHLRKSPKILVNTQGSGRVQSGFCFRQAKKRRAVLPWSLVTAFVGFLGTCPRKGGIFSG